MVKKKPATKKTDAGNKKNVVPTEIKETKVTVCFLALFLIRSCSIQYQLAASDGQVAPSSPLTEVDASFEENIELAVVRSLY